MRTRLILIFGLAMALSLAVAPTVAAHGPSHAKPLPTRIDLPDGFQPEGIESLGTSARSYGGSLVDGAIYRANGSPARAASSSRARPASAAGLHIDRLGRLWVAGAGSGSVRVYAAFTGKHLRPTPSRPAGFINDLDIVGNKVSDATDSVNQQLLVVPLGRYGRLPAPRPPRHAADRRHQYTTGFNANGIAKSDGWLIIVQSNTGKLFRVNPRTASRGPSIPAARASSTATGSKSSAGPCT